MKTKQFKTWFGFILVTVLVFFLTSSFKLFWSSPVKGSVTPSNAGIRAWLFSKTDTLSAPILQGSFMIDNVKQGNYLLMIEAMPPYRDNFRQGVIVSDGQPTDVGVIEMQQN